MEMEMERRIKNLPNTSGSENTIEIDQGQVLTVFFLAVYFFVIIPGVSAFTFLFGWVGVVLLWEETETEGGSPVHITVGSQRRRMARNSNTTIDHFANVQSTCLLAAPPMCNHFLQVFHKNLLLCAYIYRTCSAFDFRCRCVNY